MFTLPDSAERSRGWHFTCNTLTGEVCLRGAEQRAERRIHVQLCVPGRSKWHAGPQRADPRPLSLAAAPEAHGKQFALCAPRQPPLGVRSGCPPSQGAQTGELRPRRWSVSQFWRLEGRGVGTVGASSDHEGECSRPPPQLLVVCWHLWHLWHSMVCAGVTSITALRSHGTALRVSLSKLEGHQS